MVDKTQAPYYDSAKEGMDKGYTELLFTSGKAVQSRELTEIGSYARERSKKVASLLYKSGTIIKGCSIVNIDIANSQATLSDGTVFVDGDIYDINFDNEGVSKTVPIRTSGEETIFVEIVSSVVDSLTDPSLTDPAEGFDNYHEAGASRLKQVARFISTSHPDYLKEDYVDNPRIAIYRLLDGQIVSDKTEAAKNNVTEDKPAESSNIDYLDVMSQRQYETLGNYLVEGFRVKSIDCEDATKIGLIVEPGVAYINGVRRESSLSKKIYIKKNILTSILYNEDHTIDNSVTEYRLNASPVISAKVSAPVSVTTQLAYLNGRNLINVPSGYTVYKLVRVYTEGTGGRVFEKDVDFTLSGNEIIWKDSGSHPVSTFKVEYLYKPVLDSSQYSLVNKGIYEISLTLNVNDLGIAEIPRQYINPSVYSIENADNRGVELPKGTAWYQQGNNIKLVTTKNAVLPVEVVKTANAFDTIPVVEGEVESIRYFSEDGETIYEKFSDNASDDYDYTYDNAYRRITWNGDKEYFPAVGETYIANVRVPTNANTHNINTVVVTLSYELSTDIFTDRVYSSYIQFKPNVITGINPDDTFTVESRISRSRRDVICLDKEGNIVVVHGSVLGDDGIYVTKINSNLFALAEVTIKPTSTCGLAITQTDNYRVRMTDIRDMFQRVANLEYNVSLTQLEEYGEGLASNYALRGMVTDSFKNIRNLDSSATWNFITDSSQYAIPNIAEARLYPGFKRCGVSLEVNTANTTAGLKGNTYAISAGNSEVKWVEQKYGTTSRSLSEGVYQSTIFPQLEISPDSDYFVSDSLSGMEEGEYMRMPSAFRTYKLSSSGATLTTTLSTNPFKSPKAMTLNFWNKRTTTSSTRLVTFNGSKDYIYISGSYVYVVSGSNGKYVYFAVNAPANKWTHYSLVLNNRTVEALYINGTKVAAKNTNANAYYTNENVTGIVFGGSSYATEFANISVFSKRILGPTSYMYVDISPDASGLVGYYNSAISSGRIANNTVLSNASDLVIYGTVNDGSVTTDELNNPYIDSNLITNVIDLTAGTVKPTTTETSVIGTSTSSSTSVSSSSNLVTNTQRNVDPWRYASDPVWYDTYAYVQTKTTATTTTTTTTTTQTETKWYTKDKKTQVQDYGDFITDVASALYLRRLKITVRGSGLLPYTDPIEITFDGKKVNLFASTAEVKGTKSGTTGCWKADANGEFVAAFLIPENTPIGVREVEMNIPGGPSTKATYWGAGNIINKTELKVQTDTISWKENKSVTIKTSTSTKKSTSTSTSTSAKTCVSRCVSRCVTCPLGQTIFVNAPDLSDPIPSDIVSNSDVYVTSVDIYARSFTLNTQFFAGFIELSDSGYPKSGLDRWVSEVKVFSGSDLQENGGKFEYGTAKYNVKFDTPIKLRGGKGYVLVVGSPDKEARVWVAKVGDSTPTINNVKGTPIYKTEDKGTLLSSPNSQTWVSYIDEDLKYAIYIKDFFNGANLQDAPASLSPVNNNKNGKYSIVEFKEVNYEQKSGRYITEPNFFNFDIMYSNPDDNTGFVLFEYALKLNGLYGDWKEFTPGMNVSLTAPSEAIKFRAKLYSFNRYSTPTVDTQAKLVFGEYSLPSYYVSKTVESGSYNRVHAYIDKFYDETLTDIEFKYSPDAGYTWRDFNLVGVEPLSLNDETYNDKPQYQYHYEGELTLGAPEITEFNWISLPADESISLVANHTYEVAYCLKDQYDLEGPLSNVKSFVAETGRVPQLRMKINPNATGFATYIRDATADEPFKLWYDSTVSSRLKNNMDLSTNTVRVGPEGRAFPYKGTILIGSEYMKYTGKNKIDSLTYELTSVTRGQENMGRSSENESHIIGDTVYLADHCVLGRGSLTDNIKDLWKFSNCNVVRNETTGEDSYIFEDVITDKGLNTEDMENSGPLYDESDPASFESNTMKYMIKMSNKNNTSTVGREDLVPKVGRLIINTSFEAF